MNVASGTTASQFYPSPNEFSKNNEHISSPGSLEHDVTSCFGGPGGRAEERVSTPNVPRTFCLWKRIILSLTKRVRTPGGEPESDGHYRSARGHLAPSSKAGGNSLRRANFMFLSPRGLPRHIPAPSVLIQEFCGGKYNIKLNGCSRRNEFFSFRYADGCFGNSVVIFHL